MVAQLARQLSGLVAVVGAVHDQGRLARHGTEPSQELAPSGPVARLTRCEADAQRGAVVGDQRVQLRA